MPNVCLVGQRLRPGIADEDREQLPSRAREHARDGVGALLPPDGFRTVTGSLEDDASGPTRWW
jgi:hypothetical protein